MCGAELKTLPEGVQRVAAVLQASGHPHAPVMHDDAARTAQQAADALGVALGQIAKSIVFRRKSDEVAVLVIISGDQRVDEKKVEALARPDGRRLGRAGGDRDIAGQTLAHTEPEVAFPVSKGGPGEAGRQALGGGEVEDPPMCQVQTVDPCAGPCVDPPPPVLGHAPDGVAGEALGGGEGADAGLGRGGIFHQA